MSERVVCVCVCVCVVQSVDGVGVQRVFIHLGEALCEVGQVCCSAHLPSTNHDIVDQTV